MPFETARIDPSTSIKKMCFEWFWLGRALLSEVIDIHGSSMPMDYDESMQEIYPAIGGNDALNRYPMTSRGEISGKLSVNFAPPPVAS
jgi:hypothetical protein